MIFNINIYINQIFSVCDSMKFFVLFKKENFRNDLINDSFLSSVNAPSLIANEFVKDDRENALVYLYLYNHIYTESEGYSYHFDSNGISFLNGFITFEDSNRPNNLSDIIDFFYEDNMIIGDFQLFSLYNNGEGLFKTSDSSIYPCFFYEDENISVFSNELKLIVDGVNQFSNHKFVDFYDLEYISDLFFHGDNKTGTLRQTIFKNIKRVLPHDEVIINNGEIQIIENSSISVPTWFEKWYLEDKDSLYDWYYEILLNYTDSFISYIKDDVNEIGLGITGGFDSRLALLILDKICSKYDIPIKTHTSGLSEHPDVVIGGKVAKLLGVDWTHRDFGDSESSFKYLPNYLNEYASTFYISQGDFNSFDFLVNYNRKRDNISSFYQPGMDVYKRDNMVSIIKFNRWFSRRVLYQSNFYLPLFSTNYELWFALLYEKHFPNEKQYKEFVYEILKRGNPELLDIPFAFDFLPQTDVKEFIVEGYRSTNHKVGLFLWDYQFVLDELGPLFEDEFNEKDLYYNSILSESGITSFDYFALKNDIDALLENDNELSILKDKIKKLKDNAYFPSYRSLMDLNNSKLYGRVASLLIIMDFASAASFSSFYELEGSCSFNDERFNGDLDLKDKLYSELGIFSKENNSLIHQNESLKNKNKKLSNENKKLKKDIKSLVKFKESVLTSKSWKITKPLRMSMKRFK